MTIQGSIVRAGEGRPFLAGLALVKLESAAADFSVFEQRTPVNPAGVPPHIHRSYDEAFFVIEGEVIFDLGNQRQERATAGAFVFVPRGAAHRFANHGPGNARMLVIGSAGVQALVEEVAPLVGANPPDPAAINEAFARHDSEIAF
jgi:mannose-6-phosphate isomerase-like protein (cupin superfamily)